MALPAAPAASLLARICTPLACRAAVALDAAALSAAARGMTSAACAHGASPLSSQQQQAEERRRHPRGVLALPESSTLGSARCFSSSSSSSSSSASSSAADDSANREAPPPAGPTAAAATAEPSASSSSSSGSADADATTDFGAADRSVGWLAGPKAARSRERPDDEWEVVRDVASGQTAYRSVLTGEMTPPGVPKPLTWTEVVDKRTGLIYYWCRQTNETTSIGEPKPGMYGRRYIEDPEEKARAAEAAAKQGALTVASLVNSPLGWLVGGLAVLGIGRELMLGS